jgi:hypothetical protein
MGNLKHNKAVETVPRKKVGSLGLNLIDCSNMPGQLSLRRKMLAILAICPLQQVYGAMRRNPVAMPKVAAMNNAGRLSPDLGNDGELNQGGLYKRCHPEMLAHRIVLMDSFQTFPRDLVAG